MLDIFQLPVLQDNYVYLVHEPLSGETAVIDLPDAAPVLEAATKRGWTITHIFNTHHHWDHVDGNLALQAATGCQIVGNTQDQKRIPGLSVPVTAGDTVSLGPVTFTVLDVPGHTIGHIAYYSAQAGVLFCGDTLFSLGCGRLFEGTPRQMWHSLQALLRLPDETLVHCAHEYTAANAAFAETIDPDNSALQARVAEVTALRAAGRPTVPVSLGLERQTNPFLRADDPVLAQRLDTAPGVETFAEIRRRKDVF